MSLDAVNGLSFKGAEQAQQRRGTSPVTPAILLGGAVGAGTYFGLKAPMTQDEFSSSLKDGKEIKYTTELTKEQKADVEKLKKELAAEAPKEAKPETKTEAKPEAKTEVKAEAKPKTAKPKESAIDKELKTLFGKNEELSPSKYLEGRYGKAKKGTALAHLESLITDAEAQNTIPKAKKGATPTATLAGYVKHNQTEVTNAQKLSDSFKAVQETEKTAIEAEAKAAVKDSTKADKAAAKTARTAADKAAQKLESTLPKEIKDQVKAAMAADPERVKTLGTKSVGAAEAAKAIETKLETAQKGLTTAEEALTKNTAKITKMKADLDLVKGLKKGEKITKAAVSETLVATEKAVQAIEGKVKASSLETVFKAIAEKLPKVKSLKKAGIYGGIAAVVTGLAVAMMGGKKEAAPQEA